MEHATLPRMVFAYTGRQQLQQVVQYHTKTDIMVQIASTSYAQHTLY